MKFKPGTHYCSSNDKTKWSKCEKCNELSKRLYESEEDKFYCDKCRDILET